MSNLNISSERITSHIHQLADEKQVKVLLGTETGSRGWGFPSPNSDYDVRLIYVHDMEWYLSLGERKDVIEAMLEDRMVDISGWDLRKSLRLLWKSNPALLERIYSPYVYTSNEAFHQGLKEIAPQFYSRVAAMYHYLSLGKKVYEEIATLPEYNLKRFFYGLRCAMVCKWVLTRAEIPPVDFPTVLAGIKIRGDQAQRIFELIELKAQQPESYMHPAEKDMLKLMQVNLEMADEQGYELPGSNRDMEVLDQFFLKTLRSLT
ncbi:MAG: nucleotidyltransferase domain-containing protein [Bacteroidota bacterium]